MEVVWPPAPYLWIWASLRALLLPKSLYISRPVCHFYRTEFEKWAGFGPVGSSITQPVWTLFLFKSIWTRSLGSQGLQKIIFFLQIKLLSFCARIAPKRHKLRKIIKIEKNVKKNRQNGKKSSLNHVFFQFFKFSSIWGQY